MGGTIMTLRESVLVEVGTIEELLCSGEYEQALQGPLGFGMTMLLGAAKKNPENFYRQATAVAVMLAEAIERIDARVAGE